MKTLEIPTVALVTVTGGCAACGNPAHQAAASWTQRQQGGQAGAKLGSWLRR